MTLLPTYVYSPFACSRGALLEASGGGAARGTGPSRRCGGTCPGIGRGHLPQTGRARRPRARPRKPRARAEFGAPPGGTTTSRQELADSHVAPKPCRFAAASFRSSEARQPWPGRRGAVESAARFRTDAASGAPDGERAFAKARPPQGGNCKLRRSALHPLVSGMTSRRKAEWTRACPGPTARARAMARARLTPCRRGSSSCPLRGRRSRRRTVRLTPCRIRPPSASG